MEIWRHTGVYLLDREVVLIGGGSLWRYGHTQVYTY